MIINVILEEEIFKKFIANFNFLNYEKYERILYEYLSYL